MKKVTMVIVVADEEEAETLIAQAGGYLPGWKVTIEDVEEAK